VLVEQRPRMQSKAEVIALHQGETVIFAVSHRPVQGSVDSIELTCQQPDQRALSAIPKVSIDVRITPFRSMGWMKTDRRIEDRLRRRMLVRNLKLSAGYTACDDLGELPTNSSMWA